MTTKKQLMEKNKSEVKWYAIPIQMNSRSKKELEDMYEDAKRLGLLKKEVGE